MGREPARHSGHPWDGIPTGVYSCDKNGLIQAFNTRAAELWGRTPRLNHVADRFCGSYRMYRLDGTPLPHEHCPMAVALETGAPVRNARLLIERPGGDRCFAVANIELVRDEAGMISGAINSFDETDDCLQGQGGSPNELEELRNRLAAIVESSSDAIVSKDLDGTIRSWNAAAERIFGYTAEEVIGKSITILIPKERLDEETDILSRLRRGQRIEHYETVRHRKDGTPVHISLSVSPVFDGSGRIVGAAKIARDITEFKQARSRQELLTSELQHRTKNILSVVLAVVSRSFDGKRDIEEARQSVLSRLQSLGQIHDLLVESNWEGAFLADVVGAETSLYADRISVAGPDLKLNARAAQDFSLAVHELITNAAKYGALSNDSGRVSIQWGVTEVDGNHKFRFSWREHGGPAVEPPKSNGFGSSVLSKVMAQHVDGEPLIAFEPSGLRYELTGALSGIVPIAHHARVMAVV